MEESYTLDELHEDKIFEDGFKYYSGTFRKGILFKNCTFKKPFLLSNLEIEKRLSFYDCKFESSFLIKNCNIELLTIEVSQFDMFELNSVKSTYFL